MRPSAHVRTEPGERPVEQRVERPGRRSGRRPGTSGAARKAILTAARQGFAERGYDRTTIRSVAREAGVDAALVHHHFGSKADLFQAAIDLPVDPSVIVRALTEGPREEVGERVVSVFLDLWSAEAGRSAFLSLLRAAVSNQDAARALRSLITSNLLEPVARAVGRRDAALRATLAASQMVGIAMARFVVGVEPLASAPPEDLILAVAPTIQRYLTGSLRD